MSLAGGLTAIAIHRRDTDQFGDLLASEATQVRQQGEAGGLETGPNPLDEHGAGVAWAFSSYTEALSGTHAGLSAATLRESQDIRCLAS